MERYYKNKIKILEKILQRNKEPEHNLLVYSVMPDNRIKANLDKGGFQEAVYFNSDEELGEYIKENNVEHCIVGLDIDRI